MKYFGKKWNKFEISTELFTRLYLLMPDRRDDLNPIEPSWTHTKDDIRNAANLTITFEKKLCNSLNNRSYCY